MQALRQPPPKSPLHPPRGGGGGDKNIWFYSAHRRDFQGQCDTNVRFLRLFLFFFPIPLPSQWIIDPVHTKRSQRYPRRASFYCRGPPKVTSISAALLSASCPGWKARLGIVAKKVCAHVYSPHPPQFILRIVGFCHSGTDWTTARRMAPVIRLSAWVWIVGINPEPGLEFTAAFCFLLAPPVPDILCILCCR